MTAMKPVSRMTSTKLFMIDSQWISSSGHAKKKLENRNEVKEKQLHGEKCGEGPDRGNAGRLPEEGGGGRKMFGTIESALSPDAYQTRRSCRGRGSCGP